MSRSTILLSIAALTVSLAAEDFGPVVKAATQIYGATHFGVVCSYGHSQREVADLQGALPEGATLTVVDMRHPMQWGAAGSIVRQRGVELLALLPHDPYVRDGFPYATGLVKRLSNWNIPAFGTTPAALRNGCALAMGRETNWELMINPNLGIVGPPKFEPVLNGTGRGPASLDLVFLGR